MSFSPSNYFDLTKSKLAEIFSEDLPVWWALSQIERFLEKLPRGDILGRVDPGAYLVNPETIFIGKGSIVEAGAYIRGPCYIGEGCEVRHGAYIRGEVILSDHAIVGHATEVKHSLFLEGATAGHFAYIGDSILGRKVNLGAGVKCANLRLDRKNIILTWQGKKIETNLRKFGAIIGDGAQLGCNAVTNPGTLMGKMSGCSPCLSIGGIIAENQIIKRPNASI